MSVRTFGCCNARINGRVKASRPLNTRLVIQVDTSNNKIIRLLPMNQSDLPDTTVDGDAA